jgi:hypothetical protein
MDRLIPALVGVCLVVGGLHVAPSAQADSSSQYVRTTSGVVRCVIQSDQVSCEAGSAPQQPHTGFLQAPPSGPFHMDLANVTATGNFYFSDGNIGGVGSDWSQTDTTLVYGQTYRMLGWTVLPNSDGTKFTNTATGHGMFVSIQSVDSF